jgi:hypothetical protein
MIESKTIEVKFILNKKNRHESIKVNIAFEPVTSFNRKKLGAKVNAKPINNNTNNRLAYFNKTSEAKPNVLQFNELDSLSYND